MEKPETDLQQAPNAIAVRGCPSHTGGNVLSDEATLSDIMNTTVFNIALVGIILAFITAQIAFELWGHFSLQELTLHVQCFVYFTDASCPFRLGMLLRSLGDRMEDAADAFGRAAALDPGNGVVLYHLARIVPNDRGRQLSPRGRRAERGRCAAAPVAARVARVPRPGQRAVLPRPLRRVDRRVRGRRDRDRRRGRRQPAPEENRGGARGKHH